MPVLSVTEEQARRLAAGTYGRASLEHIASFGVALFIVRRGTISPRNLDSARRLLSNGTAFVVNLGEGPFAVTADHVVESALATTVETVGLFPKHFEQPGLPLVEMPEFIERIIARDADRDIATFRLTDEEVTTLGVSIFTTPPRLPTEGTGGVAFIGYPGTLRDIETVQQGPDGPELTMCWVVFPGFGVAASVSERQITCQLDQSYLTDPPPGFRHPDPDLDLGGMSGGPMLTKCVTESGIEFWAPGGVIIEGRMVPDWNGGMIYASRLDGLQANGQI